MNAGTAQRWGSSLDAVVVYAQGAICRRLARGSVPPDGRVRVTGLPRALDPGSLRARVPGAPGVRVAEARVEVEAEPLGTGDPDALRREAERLRDAHAAAEGRRDRQLSLIAEVRALHPVPPARKREDPHRRTPVDAWLELTDFVDERLTALHTRLAELEEALREAEHALDVALDRLARASTDAPAAHVGTTVCAVLTLTGTTPTETGEVEVEVEYGVPGAVWVPTYRLTRRQGEGSGCLVLRASVAQRTGEDWTGVRLALATADLRRRTDLPTLHSIRIGRRQPAPAPSGWREPPSGLGDLFSGFDAAGPSPARARGATAVGAGAAPGPLAPPPPPVGYGAPPPAPGGAYGAAMPAPAPPTGPQPPGSRARGRTGAGGGSFGGAPAAMAPPAMAPAGMAPGSALPPPPAQSASQPVEPVAGPPRPSGAELDYAALALCGPGEPTARRGLLFPDAPFDPLAAEYRRRAEAVAGLRLPGHAVRPRESAGSFDHRFDAAARADIPSDGSWHTVTVGEIPVGLRTEYLCVPSVDPTVYATLVLANATDQALLAGPVEVTVDDDFLLTAALPTLAPGGVRRVGLGPAEGIRVTRRTNLRESTSGLRNTTTVLDHRVHVELANRLTHPVTVEVRERVPVTSEPDVRIEERADWTAPDEAPDARGGPDAGTGADAAGIAPDRHAPGTRVWRLELAAGATAALDGGYEIRIPTGKALVGGNRRS
ncbi:DUF4139 domain-containing protein [Streptomyces sp. P9(2023)]|uniref:DUF4139 domain-containing protein n=1 Tax=Streptomyces sp. P9(2023) TaxID=3064394 RepID=UPI0028F428FC|nr:DUF4139 domain-containing protein [Streptomyces sp. P9(2023)]MDT9687546.1 DUF4139 domain-containing protein [Streptomyces sp. P9(2023)]